MKKVFLAGAFAVLGIITLSSCRKDYSCINTNGDETSICIGCNETQKSTFESSCNLSGGTVTAK